MTENNKEITEEYLEELSFKPVEFKPENPYHQLYTLKNNYDKLHIIIYSDEVINITNHNQGTDFEELYTELWQAYLYLKEIYMLLEYSKVPDLKHHLVKLITVKESEIRCSVKKLLTKCIKYNTN